MTDQRPGADSRAEDSAVSSTRRRVVSGFGTGAVLALAGCSNFERDPSYEPGTVGDVDGEGRTAEEMTAAEAVAQQEVDRSLAALEALSVEDHEFVLEDGYEGSTVQGTVENTGDERLESVEVRVRVYDDQDRHLGRHVASTGDLKAETTWDFQVVLLESPSDTASYDLAALGRTA